MLYNSVYSMFSSNTIYLMFVCFFVTILLSFDELNFKSLKAKLMNKKSKLYSDLFYFRDENNNNNNKEQSELKEAPGPKPYPIIGNLPALAKFDIPYQAFSHLATKYGPIIKLQLGSVPAVVVNGIDNIKEVLVNKGNHFDSRPNFRRFYKLFADNKENSLAFCNWSDLQKTRRDMLTTHTFPRNFSMRFNKLDDMILNHYDIFSHEVTTQMTIKNSVSVKPIIMELCGNIFTQYFTSTQFDKRDARFQKLVKNFDNIFWEVNQGYAADFLPFLLPLHKKNMMQMEQWSHEIRDVIMSFIGDRFENWTADREPEDYIDSLIHHVKTNAEPKFDWETALFALEDIVGGHSAVSNFVVKLLAYIAQNPQVQKKMQMEIDSVVSDKQTISLSDRNNMPYTQGVIMEALRLIASPIVPHVANQDSTIGGYLVKKDTLIFMNNYDLSMSNNLWSNPDEFNPDRFIQNGRISKPDYFIPFGVGRRSCLGYKMVNFVAFSVTANIMKQFDIQPVDDIKMKAGTLALPENPFDLIFVPRLQ